MKKILIITFILINTFILISCISINSIKPGGDMNLISSSELKTNQITSDNWREIAQNFKPGASIIFEIDKSVNFSKYGLTMKGKLINSSKSTENIIVFPVGNKGFLITLIENDKVKYNGPEDLPQQEPQPPLEILIPGSAIVEFATDINLNDYEYTGNPVVQIEWMYHYWNEPIPRGRINIELPKR